MLSQRRGKNVALVGGLFQVIFTAVMIAVWQYTGSLAAMCTAWVLAGGIALWLIVAVLFYFNELARQEAIELEEIESGQGQAPTIFEGEEGVEMRHATRRAEWMNKWAVPLATLLFAFYQAGIATLALRFLFTQTGRNLAEIGPASLFMGLTAFLAFLFSRYATGMSNSPQWRFLRATGGYLLVSVIFIACVVISLLMAGQGYSNVDLVVAYAICIIQLILAAELALNFVLELYRPRIPGKAYHPSFESRIFSIIAEPDRVGHSIADTLNYQFGFEVSRTWFYKLVGKAFVPLLALAVLIMFGMSSVVVVQQGQVCVVTNLGHLELPPLGPGLHFKLPWPLATARRFDKETVHEILLGVGEDREPTILKGRELYLWTEEHGRRKERDFLVAIQPPKDWSKLDKKAKTDEVKTPPVSMIKLVVVVQYKIDSVKDFGYNYKDSHKVLESLAYREMTSYYASATLMDPIRDKKPGKDGRPRPEAIMTFGRTDAAENLRDIIATEAKAMNLGVKIMHVGIISSHPPAKAAPAFEDVAKAELARDSRRYEAEAEASFLLAGVAGDVGEALQLALEIRKLEQLTDLSRAETLDVVELVDKYIAQTQEEINLLEKEIERERLLGRIIANKKTDRQNLLAMSLEYLGILEQIKANPGGYDYVKQVKKSDEAAEKKLNNARGTPAKLIADAEADRWQKELGERARAETFSRHLLAYRASPDMYILDRWLDVWDEVLPKAASKKVIAVDPNKIEHWLDWKWKSDMMQRVTFEKKETE